MQEKSLSNATIVTRVLGKHQALKYQYIPVIDITQARCLISAVTVTNVIEQDQAFKNMLDHTLAKSHSSVNFATKA